MTLSRFIKDEGSLGFQLITCLLIACLLVCFPEKNSGYQKT